MKIHGLFRKLTATVLAVVMMVPTSSVLPVSAADEPLTVVSVDTDSDEFSDRSYYLSEAPETTKDVSDDLPGQVDVTYDNGDSETLDITWDCSGYDSTVADDYTFYAVMDDDVNISGDLLPWITVVLKEDPKTVSKSSKAKTASNEIMTVAEDGEDESTGETTGSTFKLNDRTTDDLNKESGKSTPIGETSDGVKETLYTDKYITKLGKTVNGQETYATTIEQAVVADSVKEVPAPDKQEIVVILDASSSMGGKVSSANNGMQKFVRKLIEANNERIKNWNNGYYTNVVPGDTVDNHLLTICAVLRYNNKVTVMQNESITPTTDADYDKIIKFSTINDKQESEGGMLSDMTRTDLALAKAYDYVSAMGDNAKYSSVVLFTDGEPYGKGASGTFDYDTDSYSKLMITLENTNDALATAKKIKALGTSIYTIYIQGYSQDILSAARKSQDVRNIATTAERAGSQKLADEALGAAILSMVSSDYKNNGIMKDNGGKFTGTYDDPGEGKYGEYSKTTNNVKEIVDKFQETAFNIVANTDSTAPGYASATSYIYDVVSHPFNVDVDGGITVYQVPRIATAKGVYKWGEEEDITDKVMVSVENKKYITVKGYDYERNAITTVNKNLKNGATETFPSESGDYGYKIVVKFNIYANRNFGGNVIETNDSSVSGFYPSTPKDMTEWSENKELNESGTDWITLYPVPKVDLVLDYKIVSDDVVIFAPQTASLTNLVTDASNNLFYADDDYAALKNDYEVKQNAVEEAYDAYVSAAADYAKSNDDESLKKIVDQKAQEYSTALEAFAEAQEAYENTQSYIPDGDNNAYVDIHYSITDPDGIEIGTMDISHGTAVTEDTAWKWNYNAGDDKLITKQGDYKITATVTPVDTTRKESYTGSSATGTTKAGSFSETATTRIYVLQITGVDSSVKNGEGFLFNENSNVSISDIEKTEWLKNNITGIKWVDVDGNKTPEENGDAKYIPGTEDYPQYGGSPNASLTIPDKTHVKDENGFIANGKDGDYIPVAVQLTRTVGKLDKSYSANDKNTQTLVAMNDDDRLYVDSNGSQVSSVTWKHICSVKTNCDNTDFTNAQSNNKTTDGVQNNVRYLLHIKKTWIDTPEKIADSSLIAQNKSIKWKIVTDNTDEEANSEKVNSVGTIVDILPYNNDKRDDPVVGASEGSKFSGNLYYEEVILSTESSEVKESYTSGALKVYFTNDIGIRDIEDDTNTVGAFDKWEEASISVSGENLKVTVPSKAVAIKIETNLAFGQALTVNLAAKIDDVNSQQIGDYYINQAFAYNGSTRVNSKPSKIVVTESGISGVIFEDKNGNGYREDTEKLVSGVAVGLYTTHDPNGDAPSITVNGVQYDVVYRTDNYQVPTVTTGEDGAYKFTDLDAGTYYVIAEGVDGQYEITAKHAVEDTTIDSDAETTRAETAEPVTQVVWIKDIALKDAEMKEHMDIGLIPAEGEVTITKVLDEIYFPSTMTQDERNAYYVNFQFVLTEINDDGTDGNSRYGSVQLHDGKLTGDLTFDGLRVNKKYRITEEDTMNYDIDNIKTDDGMTVTSKKSVEFTVSADHLKMAVTYNNKMIGNPPAGDQNQVINHIPTHTPIKLEIHYTGDQVIADESIYEYTFTSDQTKATVYYDDGSTAEVSLDTTPEYTISPKTITSKNNSQNGDSFTVRGYYTEKGITLVDSFTVQIKLKPMHEFTVYYHANRGSFTYASGAAVNKESTTDVNVIKYQYDPTSGTFEALKGIYGDTSTTTVKLNSPGSGINYMGWSTSTNGAAGNKYDNEAALAALAADYSVKRVDLYARWQTTYTFNANGGKITSGSATVKAYLGDIIPASPSVTVSRSSFTFVGWMDGTTDVTQDSKWLASESQSTRTVNGPRTIYAIWYQSEYYYNGTQSGENRGLDGYAQLFTAPKSGYYKVQLWGAAGGHEACAAGNGAYVTGEIYIKAGTQLAVFVGYQGRYGNYGHAGYNGGGAAGSGYYGSWSGGGGGATDIRVLSGTSWNESNIRTITWDGSTLNQRIAVAAGGGGGGYYSNGGYGGALTGGQGTSASRGGTQTSAGQAGRFGCGGTARIDGGGGGGGWYGGGATQEGDTYGSWADVGGGGGSSYLSGYSGCAASSTGLKFVNGNMIAGNASMPMPGGGYAVGNSGACCARIQYIGTSPSK